MLYRDQHPFQLMPAAWSLVIALVATFLYCTPATAGPPDPHDGSAIQNRNIHLLSHIPSNRDTTMLAVQQEHLYTLMGSEFVVFDVSNATRPALRGSVPANIPRTASYHQDGFGYVSHDQQVLITANGKLWRFDLDAPAAPVANDPVDLTHGETIMAATPEHLFFVQDQTIYIIALPDDGKYENMEEVGRYRHDTPIADIQIVDNRAYLAASNVQVLDITDPAAPQPVAGTQPLTGNARYYTTLRAGGDRLYALTDSGIAGALDVDIIDISNPDQPQRLSRYKLDFASKDIAIWENYLFILRSGTLTVVDVTDPDAPSKAGTYTDLAGNVPDMIHIDGDLAYLAGENGWEVLDLAALPAINVIGSYTSEFTAPRAIHLRDNRHAFVGDLDAGFRTLDIGTPYTPTAVAGLEGEIVSSINEMVTAPPYVYGNERNGVYMLDVVDPERPALVSHTSGNLHVLAAEGNLAYTHVIGPNDSSRFVIFDTSRPNQWQEVGAVQIPRSYPHANFALNREDRYAYWGSQDGLGIFQVAAPTQPVHLGQEAAYFTPDTLAIADEFLFAASDDRELLIFSLADPEHPVEVNRIHLRSNSEEQDTLLIGGLEVVGNYLYLYMHFRGIKVFDISEPAIPLEAGRYYASDSFADIAGHDTLIGATHGATGISFYRFNPSDHTTQIESDGATWDAESNGVQYTFPPDAFSRPVSVTHSLRYWTAPLANLGGRAAGPVFRNRAQDPATGDPISPDAPYEIIVTYDEENLDIIPEDTLTLHWWNGDSWHPQATTIDAAGNQVTAETEHFGAFALLGEPEQIYMPTLPTAPRLNADER